MRRFYNLDTNQVQADPAFPQAITEERANRLDYWLYELAFVRSGPPAPYVDMGAAPLITFTAKPGDGPQRFDGPVTLKHSAFTKTVTGSDIFYVGRIPIDGPLLDEALGFDPTASAEITRITCVGDVGNSLYGKTFVLPYEGGSYTFELAASGSPTDPGFVAVDYDLNDSAEDVAIAVEAAIASTGAFSVSRSGAVVTAEDLNVGPRDNATAGNTGFLIEILQHGADALGGTDVAETTLAAQLKVDAGDGPQRSAIFSLIVANNLDRETDAGATVSPLPLAAYRPDLTGYTGGTASDLDSLVTLATTVGTLVSFVATAAGDGLRAFRYRAGTDAAIAGRIVRPLDYHASTHAFIWESVL